MGKGVLSEAQTTQDCKDFGLLITGRGVGSVAPGALNEVLLKDSALARLVEQGNATPRTECRLSNMFMGINALLVGLKLTEPYKLIISLYRQINLLISPFTLTAAQ